MGAGEDSEGKTADWLEPIPMSEYGKTQGKKVGEYRLHGVDVHAGGLLPDALDRAFSDTGPACCSQPRACKRRRAP
jgi:hypothetical protein